MRGHLSYDKDWRSCDFCAATAGTTSPCSLRSQPVHTRRIWLLTMAKTRENFAGLMQRVCKDVLSHLTQKDEQYWIRLRMMHCWSRCSQGAFVDLIHSSQDRLVYLIHARAGSSWCMATWAMAIIMEIGFVKAVGMLGEPKTGGLLMKEGMMNGKTLWTMIPWTTRSQKKCQYFCS